MRVANIYDVDQKTYLLKVWFAVAAHDYLVHNMRMLRAREPQRGSYEEAKFPWSLIARGRLERFKLNVERSLRLYFLIRCSWPRATRKP